MQLGFLSKYKNIRYWVGNDSMTSLEHCGWYHYNILVLCAGISVGLKSVAD